MRRSPPSIDDWRFQILGYLASDRGLILDGRRRGDGIVAPLGRRVSDSAKRRNVRCRPRLGRLDLRRRAAWLGRAGSSWKFRSDVRRGRSAVDVVGILKTETVCWAVHPPIPGSHQSLWIRRSLRAIPRRQVSTGKYGIRGLRRRFTLAGPSCRALRPLSTLLHLAIAWIPDLGSIE